jgi:hypothetical protein
MASPATPITQLVTRIPRALRRRVKLHCLMRETTLTQFVVDAISERLSAQKAAGAQKSAGGVPPRAAAR